MSRYYPLLLDIESKTCLVVGGGGVAARKIGSLLKCGAKVRLVAPEVSPETEKVISGGGIEHLNRPFEPGDVEGAALVIGATDNESVNRAVYEEAKSRNVPVNIVDQPHLCTFIVPSVVRRGDLTIAISTSGKSPAVSKRLRKHLENEFGEEWAEYLNMMGAAREKTLGAIADPAKREEVFNRLADSNLLDRIRDNDMEGAKRLVEEIVGR